MARLVPRAGSRDGIGHPGAAGVSGTGRRRRPGSGRRGGRRGIGHLRAAEAAGRQRVRRPPADRVSVTGARREAHAHPAAGDEWRPVPGMLLGIEVHLARALAGRRDVRAEVGPRRSLVGRRKRRDLRPASPGPRRASRSRGRVPAARRTGRRPPAEGARPASPYPQPRRRHGGATASGRGGVHGSRAVLVGTGTAIVAARCGADVDRREGTAPGDDLHVDGSGHGTPRRTPDDTDPRSFHERVGLRPPGAPAGRLSAAGSRCSRRRPGRTGPRRTPGRSRRRQVRPRTGS